MFGIQNFNSQNNSENKGKWSFEYNTGTSLTFDPNLTKSGRPRWNIDDGSLPLVGDTISVNPLINGHKSVEIWVDKLENIDSVIMDNNNIIGILDFTGFDNCTTWTMNGIGNPGINSIIFPQHDIPTLSINWGTTTQNSSLIKELDLTPLRKLSGDIDFENHKFLETIKLPSDIETVFDGVDEYVNTTNNYYDFIDYNKSFSMSVWVRPESFITSMVVLDKFNRTLETGLTFVINSSGQPFIFIRYNNGNYQFPVCDTSISINSWSHILFTYDGSNNGNGYSFYINGVLSTKTIATNNPITDSINTTTDFTIGQRINGETPFDGNITNASIYNTELSQIEITDIYNKGRFNPDYSNINGILSHWRLNSLNPIDEIQRKWTIFDGIDEYINCGYDNDITFNYGKSNSFSCWIYPTVDGVNNYIISNFESSDQWRNFRI